MIDVTPFGIAFAALLLLTWGRPERLLALVVFGAVFDAATVANLRLGAFSFGIQPAYAAGIGFVAAMVLRSLAGQSMGNERRVLYAFWPFVLFCTAAAASSVILPKLLGGRFYVWPQRPELGTMFPTPLAFTPGNVTQTGYLLLGAVMAFYACCWIEAKEGAAQRLLRVYLFSGTTAALIGLWQWLSRATGLFFPHDFLFTNPNWSDLADEVLGSYYRISGSFNEPSFFCFYLSGVIFGSLWMIVSTGPTPLACVAFCSSFTVALMSTSTTAYATVIIGIPILALFAARTPRAGGRIAVALAAAVPAALIAAFLVWRLAPGLIEMGTEVAQETAGKTDSISYEIRARQDADSFALVAQTLGAGVGWGSIRASSLLATVAGATGVWGPGLLAWFALRVARGWQRARPMAGANLPALEAFAASVIGMLVAAAISKPDLTFSGFWTNLAAATAAGLQSRRFARATAKEPVSAGARAEASGRA